MPCDTYVRRGQTPADREREIKEALKRLEGSLAAGSASVVVGSNGALAFTGWGQEERSGVTDVCAYRLLMADGSWELRQAIARAEAIAGRSVDRRVIESGVHSHDGGATWAPGH